MYHPGLPQLVPQGKRRSRPSSASSTEYPKWLKLTRNLLPHWREPEGDQRASARHLPAVSL